MTKQVRVTVHVAKVLRVMLADPLGEHYGYKLMTATALPSGVLYPILRRLEAAGWITARTDGDAPAYRPPRRYCRLTDDGAAAARAALDALRADLTDDERPA